MIIYLTFYSVYELVFYHVAIGELRFSFFLILMIFWWRDFCQIFWMILSSKLKERTKHLMMKDFKLTTMHCVTGGGLSHDVEQTWGFKPHYIR